MENKNNKKKILGVAAFVALIAVMGILYFAFAQKAVEGSKSITIEVVNSQGESKVYELTTDAEYLAQAMDEAEGLEYTAVDSMYGLTVQSVNGESAVYEVDKAYWGFYVNGEYCNYGISQQPVMDGDAFKIEYTPA